MKRSRHVIVDLLDKPGHLIRRAHQICVGSFETLAAPFKITAPQHVVMTALYKHPNVDQATLARMVGLDKVTTGSIVMRLEQRRLLQRKRSARDQRAHVLTLSENGRRLLLDMQPVVKASKEEILENLSGAERAQLIRLLRRLIGAEPPARAAKPRAPKSRAAKPRPRAAATDAILTV